MKAYQFTIPRKSTRTPGAAPLATEPKKQEQMGLIQGRQPASWEEWRVASALMKYKIPFYYQVPIYGGRLVRGGQVVDFLVINPFPIPVQVFGEYWHPDELEAEERLGLITLEQYYGRPPVILWGNELQTQQMADERIAQEFL